MQPSGGGPRLTWEQGAYNTLRGLVGVGPGRGVELFVIVWKSKRDDPNWLMRTELPGVTWQTWKDDDRDALKAEAEKALADWLGMVNGGRPL